MSNPIQYTSRTFESILSDINSDNELIDKPNWFKRLIAGVGDVISMWNNALANNLLLDTAYTRRNVQLLLELIDYWMYPQSTSSGILIFHVIGTASFPFTVQVGDLVGMTAGSISVSSKRFEARSSVNVTSVSENFIPAAVNAGTDIITVVREFTTGEKVRFSTTGGLPAPLVILTDYYIIKISATEIKIATTLSNALAEIGIDITTQGTGTHTITLYSFQTTCYQQETKEQTSIGVSDGVTEWQEFDLTDYNILEDTLVVTINSIQWTKVDTFAESENTDKHYRLYYNSDNSAKIQFGDGTYGEIPPVFDIYVDYAIGGGGDSNVTVINKINIYGGSDLNIEGVINPAPLTGGANAEGINSAKILGPLLLKARNRFITSEDGEALAQAYLGIAQANVIKNAYGVLSAKVVTIASGGGNPSAAIKSALQTYLIDRTILESVDVRVEDTTITPVNVTSAAKVLGDYTWSGQVENWFRLGWKLFLSEAGKEIQDDYNSNGVDSARTLINTIFSEGYTSNDNTQIQKFLDNLDPATIGSSDIQKSDAFGFLDSNVIGLDYLTITIPAFPISFANDEITTYGSLTLTEIT